MVGPVAVRFLFALALAAGAGGQGSAMAEPQPSPYELVFLAADWNDLALGYAWEEAWPKLRAAAGGPGGFVVREADVQSYYWPTQRVTLTPEATTRLLAGLRELKKEPLRKLLDRSPTPDLERLLYQRPWVVRVGGEPLYGGIGLDAISAMGINFPVIHGQLAGGRAVLRFLPAHMPFDLDPRFEESARGVPPAPPSAAPRANPFLDRLRALIRDPRVRAVFERAGKLEEAGEGR
jgi:hypothetical protein